MPAIKNLPPNAAPQGGFFLPATDGLKTFRVSISNLSKGLSSSSIPVNSYASLQEALDDYIRQINDKLSVFGGDVSGTLTVNGSAVLTASTVIPQIKENQVEAAGSFVIGSLQDLLNAAQSHDSLVITLSPQVDYKFTTIVNVGAVKVNLNGASLSAAVMFSSGIQGTGPVLLESSDVSVFLGKGLLILGDPSGSTSIFNFSNPTNSRNLIAIESIVQFNNSRSVINGFKNIECSASFSESADGIDFDLINAKNVNFINSSFDDDITASKMINMPNEGVGDLEISITATKARTQPGKITFFIENSSQSALSINVSGNQPLGDGDFIAGPEIEQDNYLSKGNPNIPNTHISANFGFTSEEGVVTSITEDVFSPVNGTFNLGSDSIGFEKDPVTGWLKVSRPVKNESVMIVCGLSADVSGSQERTCALRIERSEDGGSTWVGAGFEPLFLTRQTAGWSSVHLRLQINQGDLFRPAITNKGNDSDIRVYTCYLEI